MCSCIRTKNRGKEWATSVLKDIVPEELLKQAFPDGTPKDFHEKAESGDVVIHDKLDEAFFILAEDKLAEAKEEEDYAEYMEEIQRETSNFEAWDLLMDEFKSGVYEGVVLSKENLIEKL